LRPSNHLISTLTNYAKIMDTTTNLSSLIWSSADDVLRGLFKPSEYGRVILPFVVMRRLDCVLEPKKDEVFELYTKYKDQLSDPTPVILRQVGYPFFNSSKFDLSRIKSDPNNVLMNFNNYVQGYSKNVLDIIENFSINPLVEKLHKNKRLYLLIDKFTEFDLHPNKIDNHQMGSVYEELLRKFSEMSNEESGDHFTPRDVVKLLVSFVFGGDRKDLQGEGKIRSVFDPCCGTGGMLTIGKEWIHENINPNLKVDLYGQELNDVTYSICKSDLLMMDENPENIHGPCSSISDDRLQGRKFDYMITNPPFGVSWKSEEEFVTEEAKDPNGRFFVGTPRTSDGSLLFLQHLIHKMNPEGSRIGVVFNGSPLFTGDAGSGESEIRKWVIENDWLECIVSLPDRMFFNTGITTYIWIVTNKKSPERKGKVQLIDGSSFWTSMRKNLGDKGKYITEEQKDQLFNIYQKFEESEFCKIYPNNFFGYTKVVVEQPLIEDGELKKDRQGNPKPDTSKRDNERVSLSESIEDYYEREVKPHLPNSWMDRSKDKIGYEINFTKYFYKFTPLRSLEEISKDLKSLDNEIQQLSMEMTDE
jgi:type I restriction enzyme M protein